MGRPGIRSLAYRTDAMIVRAWGGSVMDAGDHWVFRTPRLPDHFNGNLVLFDGPPGPDALDAWPAAFRAGVPPTPRGHLVQAGWDDPAATREAVAAFAAAGFTVAVWETLVARSLPPSTPPAGVALRPIAGWDAVVALLAADFDAEAQGRLVPYFQRMAAAYCELVEAGCARWVGAYDGDALVGMVGVVVGEGLARCQWVMTAASHRRRGVSRALLREAGAWALGQGAEAVVIVATAGDPAGAVYRGAGFEAQESVVRVSRRFPPAG